MVAVVVIELVGMILDGEKSDLLFPEGVGKSSQPLVELEAEPDPGDGRCIACCCCCCNGGRER